jgi:hypothetical protein
VPIRSHLKPGRAKTTTLAFALGAGELVVRRLYGGDVSRFRSRKVKDDRALRRIATHPDLAMSASMLYGCVGIYEICQRMGIRSWSHVSTSHIRLVLPLAHESQVFLLRDAETHRWPVKRLEQEVDALKQTRRPRGGRPRHSPIVRAIHALDRDVHALSAILAHADDSPACERVTAKETLRRVVELCQACEERLRGNT